VVIHYEEALYQVYAPLPLTLTFASENFIEIRQQRFELSR